MIFKQLTDIEKKQLEDIEIDTIQKTNDILSPFEHLYSPRRGVKPEAKFLVKNVLSKILNSKANIQEFVFSQLHAASLGDIYTKTFVQSTGISEQEYKNIPYSIDFYSPVGVAQRVLIGATSIVNQHYTSYCGTENGQKAMKLFMLSCVEQLMQEINIGKRPLNLKEDSLFIEDNYNHYE